MELNSRNIKIIMGLILFASFAFYGINHLIVLWNVIKYGFHLILPFVLGFAIAFILNVPMKAIEKRLSLLDKKVSWANKFKRPLSLVLTYILFIGVILLILFLVIPELVHTINIIIDNAQGAFNMVKDYLMNLYRDSPDMVESINSININWDELVNSMKNTLTSGLGSVVNSTIGVVSSTVSFVIEFVLGFVFSVYLLLQKEELCLNFKKMAYAYLPKKYTDRIIEILQLSNKAFSNFLTGQCLEALILGFMFLVSMTIFRFPYALTISVFISFTALVPIFGAFLGCLLGVILIAATNLKQALWFIVLFLALQQLEENLVYPRVVGESVGLPSIWVLVAVTLGGNTLGIVGMILFIPMFSVIYTLLRKDVRTRLKEKKILC